MVFLLYLLASSALCALVLLGLLMAMTVGREETHMREALRLKRLRDAELADAEKPMREWRAAR